MKVYRIGYRDGDGKYHYLEADDKRTVQDAIGWLIDVCPRVTIRVEEKFVLNEEEEDDEN